MISLCGPLLVVVVNVCIHDFDDAKEESNKAATFASRLIQDCFNKQSLDSRFLQDQALPQNKGFQSHARLWQSITRRDV